MVSLLDVEGRYIYIMPCKGGVDRVYVYTTLARIIHSMHVILALRYLCSTSAHCVSAWSLAVASASGRDSTRRHNPSNTRHNND